MKNVAATLLLIHTASELGLLAVAFNFQGPNYGTSRNRITGGLVRKHAIAVGDVAVATEESFKWKPVETDFCLAPQGTIFEAC